MNPIPQEVEASTNTTLVDVSRSTQILSMQFWLNRQTLHQSMSPRHSDKRDGFYHEKIPIGNRVKADKNIHLALSAHSGSEYPLLSQFPSTEPWHLSPKEQDMQGTSDISLL
jgi:hypothetical protein